MEARVTVAAVTVAAVAAVWACVCCVYCVIVFLLSDCLGCVTVGGASGHLCEIRNLGAHNLTEHC